MPSRRAARGELLMGIPVPSRVRVRRDAVTATLSTLSAVEAFRDGSARLRSLAGASSLGVDGFCRWGSVCCFASPQLPCLHWSVWLLGRRRSRSPGRQARTGSHRAPISISPATSNGTAWSWGDNTFGELGNGTTTDASTPVEVSGLSNVVQVSGGDEFSAALKADGTVWGLGQRDPWRARQRLGRQLGNSGRE